MVNKEVFIFVDFVRSKNGIGGKPQLIKEVCKKFAFTKDRSIYYTKNFAVRFSSSDSSNFSNTVLSLSNLQKYDFMPFLICLVTPKENFIYLANSTFLRKISHSSQELRVDNIRGSFNGSDIAKEFNDLRNSPENFEELFSIHEGLGFEGNLTRLVEATNNISPSGIKFVVDSKAKGIIHGAPERACQFVTSKEYTQLKSELDSKVAQFTNEILIAGFIENVNVRGRIIEYLIAGKDDKLKSELIHALQNGSRSIPNFKTEDSLGDYTKIFDKYHTETDVKTKIMLLHSNPKAYNIDKLLEFLSTEKSVFMFYFIGLEPNKIVNQVLVSMFQENLLKTTILLKHWAGRNSRGVTQFEGSTIHKLILSPNNKIDKEQGTNFLKTLVDL